jgi:hypothetical protein
MSNRWLLFPLVVTFASAAVSACGSSDDGSGKAGSGAASAAGESVGGADAEGSSAAGGGLGDAGATAVAGASNSAGEPGSAGSGASAGSSSAGALPLDTFLYEREFAEDREELVARSFTTGEEYVVTDLTSDGSDGWEIWGHTLSADRKTIVLASLYGPTKADNDTQLATRRLWSLATDGSGFERLTPVFDNDGAGRSGFNISVEDPAFTRDGGVLYDFGNWWYEGTSLEGGSLPWLVPAAGGLPEPFPTVTSCTVVAPAVHPVTGEVLLVHSVCVSGQDEGLYLYPSEGSTKPLQLLARGFGPNDVDPSLTAAGWIGDGSGFIFVGAIDVDRGDTTERVPSLLVYEAETGSIASIVVPEPDSAVRSATISADGLRVVYCLEHGSALDLHAIDLNQDPVVDVPLTDDGVSCEPKF